MTRPSRRRIKQLAKRLRIRRVLNLLVRRVNRWRARGGGGYGRIRPDLAEAHCRPITDPEHVAASSADYMREDDVVLGIEVNGESRAYPWWIMDNHHAANDVVGGQPLLVILCELCSTAMAYDAQVGGRRLTFEMSHIFNGTTAMHDHQTGSVWSPMLAQAIRGPLKGTNLRHLALEQMEWHLWRQLHPETRVLPEGMGSRSGHGSHQSPGSPGIYPPFRRSVGFWDTRLPYNTLVLGVKTPGVQRVYTLDGLRRAGGVINDELDGLPIVVLYLNERGSYAALAFSRLLEGRVLTFDHDPRGAIDRQTGTRWNVEGKAVDGPLRGAELTFVPSHVSEWYVWGTHFRDLQIVT